MSITRIAKSILHRVSVSLILSPPSCTFDPQSRKSREITDIDGGAEDNSDFQFEKASLYLRTEPALDPVGRMLWAQLQAEVKKRQRSYTNLADPKKIYEILTGQRRPTEETSSSLSRLLPQPTHQPLFNPVKLPAISACMPPLALGLIGKTETVKIDSFCTGLAFTADDSDEIKKYVVLYTGRNPVDDLIGHVKRRVAQMPHMTFEKALHFAAAMTKCKYPDLDNYMIGVLHGKYFYLATGGNCRAVMGSENESARFTVVITEGGGNIFHVTKTRLNKGDSRLIMGYGIWEHWNNDLILDTVYAQEQKGIAQRIVDRAANGQAQGPVNHAAEGAANDQQVTMAATVLFFKKL